MNRKQIIVLWIGIALIVLMGLFPPWHVKTVALQKTFGYASLLKPPETYGKYEPWQPTINTPRLLVQWCVVGFIATGFIITFKHS